MGTGLKFHRGIISRGHRVARRYFWAKTNLHEGTNLHESKIKTENKFINKKKKKLKYKLIKEQKEKKVTDRE